VEYTRDEIRRTFIEQYFRTGNTRLGGDRDMAEAMAWCHSGLAPLEGGIGNQPEGVVEALELIKQVGREYKQRYPDKSHVRIRDERDLP